MAEKIHIQHVVLSLQPGGLENGVVNVVNGLPSDRFRSSVCCLKRAGEFASRITSGASIYEMGWKGGNDLRMPLRLARLFRETRPDIVHTRNVESFYYGFLGAKLAGIDCVIHSEHGRAFDDRPIRFWIQRLFSARTQAIFTVSGQLKRDLVAYTRIPEKNVRVLHNGVDIERFRSGGSRPARSEFGIREGDVVIGSVGRLVAVKNYPLLLKAVAALGRSDVSVVLVGGGPEEEGLRALAVSLGIRDRVHLLGHRDDVTSLLGLMDIFVLPSTNEGMSNTLLEAMATGLPCVASDVGGNPELVSHGKDGYLFASGDEAALKDRLLQLCGDASLRASLGEAARARIMRDFSIESMIGRYEALYTESLHRKRQSS